MKNIDLSKFQEVPITREVMQELLSNIPSDLILVGGQALAFWIEQYKIELKPDPADNVFVSRDADFLGTREHVKLLADAISGITDYPSKKALTILCGQIFLFSRDEKTFMNIDVIHRIGNMDSDGVRRRAVEATINNAKFYVMHPLDVLISRAENYRGIKEKQDSQGLRQLKLSIDVARQYVFDVARHNEGVAIKAIEKIAETARSAAGMYARKHGVEIYDAINPNALAGVISNKNFISERLPRLAQEIDNSVCR